MSWHELISTELGLEMRRFAGEPYEILEDRAWQAAQIVDEHRRAYDADRHSRAPERRYRAMMCRRWREDARSRVVAVRCCPICRLMYVVTAYHSSNGRVGACSPHHRYLATGDKHGNFGLITLGREQDTLTGWARRHGLTAQGVDYRRKALGWSLELAITTPATPLGARRWGVEGDTTARRARAACLPADTVRSRLRAGWDPAEAFATPKYARARASDPTTVSARARAAGLKPRTVRDRVARGISLDAALATPLMPPGGRRKDRPKGGGPVTAAILAAVDGGVAYSGAVLRCVLAAVPRTTEGSVWSTMRKLVRIGRLVRDGGPGAFTYRLPAKARAT